jgi:hypothetical protein
VKHDAKLARRTFLRGAAGVSLALPLMPSLAFSQAAPVFPKRFLVFYMPNGNIELAKSLDFAGSIMEPLTPFKNKLIVLSGLDLSVHNLPPGEPHQQGMAFLTGRPLNKGNQVGGDGTLAGWASGISVDQEIANVTGKGTPHKSLHFGVQSTAYGGSEVRTVISYSGADQPIANETSPYSMFTRVFSKLGADPLGLERLRARRHSVLDAVGKQYATLGPRLGKEDRVKLEQHLTSVRDVELRLDNKSGSIGGSCQVPTMSAPINLNDPNNYPAIGRLQTDLLVMALRCDLTRVATIQWSASTNNKPYPYLKYDDGSGSGPQPIVGDEHVMGHEPDTNVHAWGKLRVIRRWYMEQFAYLLGQLDAVQEGAGTMLDNTVILLGSEVARGNTHSHMNAPFILAGSAGGYLKTGQYLTFPGDVSHNNLLVSLLNAMGLPATRFGHPDYCTGPLTGLVA